MEPYWVIKNPGLAKHRCFSYGPDFKSMFYRCFIGLLGWVGIFQIGSFQPDQYWDGMEWYGMIWDIGGVWEASPTMFHKSHIDKEGVLWDMGYNLCLRSS